MAVWHKLTARIRIESSIAHPVSSRGLCQCSRRSKSFSRALHGRGVDILNRGFFPADVCISCKPVNSVFRPDFPTSNARFDRCLRRPKLAEGQLSAVQTEELRRQTEFFAWCRLTHHSPREDRGMHSRAFDSEVSGQDYALRPRKPPHGGKPAARAGVPPCLPPRAGQFHSQMRSICASFSDRSGMTCGWLRKPVPTQ